MTQQNKQPSPAGEGAQETLKAPSTGHCPVCGEAIYGAAHLGCWSRMLACLREHGFAVVRDAPSLPPERAALADKLIWAADWIDGLETPARPAPSAWSEIDWLNYWRDKRKGAADVVREAAAALRGETGGE